MIKDNLTICLTYTIKAMISLIWAIQINNKAAAMQQYNN